MNGMTSTKIAAWVGAVGALLCLLAGFGLKGYWEILFVIPALPLYWLLTRKVSPRLTASILFFIYILLVAAGLVAGMSAYLMLIGGSLALAAWESAQFLSNFRGLSGDGAGPRLEQLHNRSLLLAIGSGLLLGLLGLNVHVRLPFGAIVVLALVAVVGLYLGFTSRSRGV